MSTIRPLLVEEMTGIDRERWPVIGGIPFARGEVSDLHTVRLADAGGREVPAQLWELSRWPDGSLRWVCACVEATVGRQQRLEGAVEFGPEVTRQEPARAVTVTLEGATLRAETAALKLVLQLDPLHLAAARADGTTLILAGQDDGFWLTDAAGKRFTARATEVEVELEGPLYSLVRLTGNHLAADGASLLDFMLRIHLFAHAPWVQFDYTFINREDAPLDVELGEIAFTASLPPEASRLATCGAYRALYEREGGLVVDMAMPQHLTGIFPNAKVMDPEGNPLEGAALGWADLSGPAGGVCLALRDYAENHPKRTLAAGGKLQLSLWPREAGPLKLHQGMAKTHMLMLYLHAGSGKEARASEIAQGFCERLVFTPQPWYLETKVFGDILPFYPRKYPNIERRMRDEFIGWEDGNRALGMMDWGDFPQLGMEGREKFMGNNEHDFMHSVLLQWMRSGERKLLRALDASIYHTMDVDTVHHSTQDPNQVGAVRAHSDDHWDLWGRSSCGPSHMWAEGLAEYYCLFGDRRALEAARGICDFLGRLDQSGLDWTGDREAGWACISLIPTYEASGDARYLETARHIIYTALPKQNPDGSFFMPLGFWDSKCPMQINYFAIGMMYYLQVADDAVVRDAFLRVSDWRVKSSTYPDGATIYVDHWDYSRSRSGADLREALGYAYKLTGRETFVRLGMQDHERCFEGYGSEMLNIWAWGINHAIDHVATIMGHTIAMNWRGNLRFMYWAEKAGLMRDIESV